MLNDQKPGYGHHILNISGLSVTPYLSSLRCMRVTQNLINVYINISAKAKESKNSAFHGEGSN